MAKKLVKFGATSNWVRVRILDSSSTTSAGLTGVLFSTTGLVIDIIANNSNTAYHYKSAATATIEDITTPGTYAAPSASNCRFKAVDATNFPGLYEIQFLDGVFDDAGCTSLIGEVKGVTNMAPCTFEIQLTAFDPDAALATPTNITTGTITTVTNLTNLPAAAALESTLTSMKGATFSGTTDSLEALRDRGDAAWITATGFATPTNITAGTITTVTNLTNAPTNGDLTATMKTSVATASDAVAIKADTAAILIDTGSTLDGRIPTALTAAGNMKADALAINGSTDAAATIAILNGANIVYKGTVTGAATTTTLIDSGLTQADADWWKGRIIIFTSVITLQATDITAFDPATDKLTFTVCTQAPAGATYVII